MWDRILGGVVASRPLLPGWVYCITQSEVANSEIRDICLQGGGSTI